MSSKAKKIIKIVLCVIALACFVGIIYHFIRALSLSLHDNDIKTAQNRINSAYQFLMLISAGVCFIGTMFGIFSIKERVFPKVVGKVFEVEEEVNTTEVK